MNEAESPECKIGSQHDKFAVGNIDNPHHSPDQSEAHSHKGINRAQHQTSDEDLNKIDHSNSELPSLKRAAAKGRPYKISIFRIPQSAFCNIHSIFPILGRDRPHLLSASLSDKRSASPFLLQPLDWEAVSSLQPSATG